MNLKARECLFRERGKLWNRTLRDSGLEVSGSQRPCRGHWEVGEGRVVIAKEASQERERASNGPGGIGPLKAISWSTWGSCPECC